MAEPIEIIIRQGGQGGTGFGSATGGGIPSAQLAGTKRGAGWGKEGQDLIKNAVIDDRIVAAIENQLKAGIMYSISSYGNMTGDYIGQQRIQSVLSIGNDLLTIGAATYKMGAVGLAVTATTTAVKFGMNIFNYNINVQKQNTQASFMRERSGNSLNNGSSGTYE